MDENNMGEHATFRKAITAGNIDMVKELLMEERAARLVNQPDKYNKKLVYYACIEGQADIFQLLFNFTEINEQEEIELKDKLEALRDEVKYKKIYFCLYHPFDHLWENEANPVSLIQKIHFIFKDYYAPLNFSSIPFDRAKRILSGHWGRHHLEKAQLIATAYLRYLATPGSANFKSWDTAHAENDLKLEVQEIMASPLYNRTGCFAKRLDFAFQAFESEKLKPTVSPAAQATRADNNKETSYVGQLFKMFSRVQVFQNTLTCAVDLPSIQCR